MLLPPESNSNIIRPEARRQKALRPPEKQHHPPGGKTAKEYESNESTRAREQHSASTSSLGAGFPEVPSTGPGFGSKRPNEQTMLPGTEAHAKNGA